MKRVLWMGSVVALFCLTLFSLRNAYTAESAQESMQFMVEVMIFKVELGPQNIVGLTWGKDGEMRKKDSSTIVEWLKKQGDLTLICGRNFYAADKTETLVRWSPALLFQAKSKDNQVLNTKMSGPLLSSFLKFAIMKSP